MGGALFEEPFQSDSTLIDERDDPMYWKVPNGETTDINYGWRTFESVSMTFSTSTAYEIVAAETTNTLIIAPADT